MSFLIYSTQRSGTMLLTTSLNSHPQLSCEPEIPALLGSGTTEGKILAHVSSYDKFSGGNLKYDQFKVSSLLSGLEDCSLIHLIRKNSLETAISLFINNHKKPLWGIYSHIFKDYNVFEEQIGTLWLDGIKSHDDVAAKHRRHSPRPGPSALSIKEITSKQEHRKRRPANIVLTGNEITLVLGYQKAISAKIIATKKIIDESNNKVYTIFYEDLIEDGWDISEIPANTSFSLCRFLGVEERILMPQTMKSNYIKYEDFIINYQELLNKSKKEKYND